MTDTATDGPETFDDIDFEELMSRHAAADAAEEAPEPDPPETVDVDEEPEVEGEEPTDKVETEDDPEPAEPEAEAEPEADEESRKLTVRVNHRDMEFDPWEDESRTVELVQKGMDYDRQRELAEKARAEVEQHRNVTSNIMSELQRRGVVRQAPTGGWQWVDGATPAQDVAPDPELERIESLRATAAEEGTPDAWQAYMDAVAEHKAKQVVDSRLTEAEKRREQELRRQAEQQAEQQRTHVWQQADAELSRVGDTLKNLYLDPHTQQVDEDRLQLEVYRAKQELRRLVGENDAEAWQKVLGELERRSKAYQASQLERTKALTSRRSRRKAAPPAPSGGAPSPTPKRKVPETIDDIDPSNWFQAKT